jgi:hypothetical protein
MRTQGAVRFARYTVFTLACAFAMHATADPVKENYSETVDQSFPLSTGGLFTLENRNGSVEVSTWDKDEVRVVAEKQMRLDGDGWWLARLIGMNRSRITTDEEAQALFKQLIVECSGDEKRRTVNTRYPESQDVNCTVTYRITAPKKTRIEVDTVNGSIHVRGVEGETTAATTSGSVSVEDVVGRVHAITTNGKIDLAGISGPVQAKSTNGSVSVRLSGAAKLEDVEMHSVNGSVRLYVPADAAFAVKARTVNGSVRCDLPLASVATQSRKRLDGVVGADGAQVELSTTNGSVQIGAIS